MWNWLDLNFYTFLKVLKKLYAVGSHPRNNDTFYRNLDLKVFFSTLIIFGRIGNLLELYEICDIDSVLWCVSKINWRFYHWFSKTSVRKFFEYIYSLKVLELQLLVQCEVINVLKRLIWKELIDFPIFQKTLSLYY